MFGLFKKRNKIVPNENKAVSKNCLPKNEIDTLYSAKKYDEVISKITALTESGQGISFETKRTLALSYFYKEDYDKAIAIFMEIAQKKNDLESWFNCLNPLLIAKKMQEAQNVYNTIQKMNKDLNVNQPRELAPSFVRYYYACGLNDAGLFEKALEHLEELKKVYMALKITDDTFVYIRGVPFLSNTLELAKKVYTGLEKDFANSDYLKELKRNVDSDGKALIEKYEKDSGQ